MDDITRVSYQYSALNADQKEIRLLFLLPGSWSQPLQCELKIISLIDLPVYNALSYVWGDPQVTKPIILHGHLVQVTTNLEAALRRLRDGAAIMHMWVDALCINQKDNSEKSLQVAIMDQIYARSDTCIIWLGDILVPLLDEEKGHPITVWECDLSPWNSEQPISVGETDFDELIWGLGEYHAAFWVVYLLSKNKHLHEYAWYQPGPEMDASIAALQRLASTWWWNRVWTVQETVLPARPIVVCGPYHASWEMFAAAARNLRRHVNSCCKASWIAMNADRKRSSLTYFSSAVSEFEQIRKQRLAVFGKALRQFLAKLDRGEVTQAECLDSSSSDPRLNVPFAELMEQSGMSEVFHSNFQPKQRTTIQELTGEAISATSLSRSIKDPSLIELGEQSRKDLKRSGNLSSSSGDQEIDLALEGCPMPAKERMWATNILPEDDGDCELPTLPQLLWTFRNRQATNPRDQIYALHGLVRRWYAGQPPTPDYQLPILSVWAQAITECINLNDFSVFMGMRSQDTQLASWIPAWDQWTEDGGTGINTNNVETAEKQHKTYHYFDVSAGKSVCDFSLVGNVLSLSAIYLDKILAVGIVQPAQSHHRLSTLHALQQWQLLIDLHLNHDESYANKSFTREQAFWHTVSRDMFLHRETRRQLASENGEKESTVLQLVINMIALDQISEDNAGQQALVGIVTSIIFAMSYKSRFFVTERGWFGLANSEVSAGDEVHILIGSKVPFVLRNVSERREAKNTYQLVSDCYLHGVMDGEVISQCWEARDMINIV